MVRKSLLLGVLLLSILFTESGFAQKTAKPVGGKVPKPQPVEESKSFPVAQPFTNEYGVEWHPTVDTAIELTVSGPNEVSSKTTFGLETLPYFDFYDENGNLRPDGVYIYELKVIPNIDPSTHQKMEAIRESPNRQELIEEMKSFGELPEETPTQMGSFTFKGHEVIMGDAVNMKTLQSTDMDDPNFDKIIVHNQDVTIQGSECIGFDCTSGENFGFDTLRLKENNLRIRFSDTSNSGSFPTRDWQLTANDTTNGGASYFSIDDVDGGRTPFRLIAGAPSNSLYVDAQGDVGMGTSNPIVELHLADGDTPTIRLEQDGSSGWTAQTWDVAGNETNFFIRDVNNGSKLPFRIRPGAPDNSLYIDTDGDVGIGTNAPSAKLDVRGSAMINGDLFAKDGATVGSSYYGSSNIPDNGLIVEGNSGFGTDDIESWDPNWGAIELGGTSSIMYNRGNGSYHASNNAYFNGVWRYKQTGAPAANYHQHNGEHIWRTAPSGTEDAAITWTEGMRVDENGRVGIQNNNPSALLQVGTGGAVCNGTTWIDGSSRDFKKQIQDLSEADLEELMKVLDDVDMVSYLYKQESDDTPRHVGMIAEEMPDILASKDRKGLELGRHVGFLMGVVKVLKTQNEEMAQELEQLKAEIAAIKENK